MPKKIHLWPEPPKEGELSGLVSAPTTEAIELSGFYHVFPPPPKRRGRPTKEYKDTVRGKIIKSFSR
jgi:hypothetical protein